MKNSLLYLLIISVLGFSAGCGKKRIPGNSEEDNPVHHYLMGMALMDKNDISEADRRFDRALELHEDFAPALAGKALLAASRCHGETDGEHKRVELERAMDYLDEALDEAQGDSQEFSVRVTGIRVFSTAKPEDWLEDAQEWYHKAVKLDNVKAKALPYYRNRTAADYFMGVAFFKGYRFADSGRMLARVLGEPDDRWHTPAERLYASAQKIIRASANYTLTDVAKRIAIKDTVVRADVAALLVDEIHLDRFFAGPIPGPSKPQDPQLVPADVLENPFKDEILVVLKWRLRGLELEYNQRSRAYLFQPDHPVKRKALALILEDILIKITNDTSLPTRHLGQDVSPFPDVSPSASYFNAVMNAVNRGLMEPELSGAFQPENPADGAELIQSVMRLRNVMNIH